MRLELGLELRIKLKLRLGLWLGACAGRGHRGPVTICASRPTTLSAAPGAAAASAVPRKTKVREALRCATSSKHRWVATGFWPQ